jgi:hypothetical protein
MQSAICQLQYAIAFQVELLIIDETAILPVPIGLNRRPPGFLDETAHLLDTRPLVAAADRPRFAAAVAGA